MRNMRDYTTWEEEFTGDRCELHGYNDELVAVVDWDGNMWFAVDVSGKQIERSLSKIIVQAAAEALLHPAPKRKGF